MSFPAPPNPGDRISASLLREIIRCLKANTPIQGPGILLARGPNGTTVSLADAPCPKKSTPRPFEVHGSDSDDYKFAIYVPANVVSIGGSIVTPTGISALSGATDWYSLDDEDDVGEDDEQTLWLVAYDNDSAEFTFDLSSAVNSSSQRSVVAALPIAVLTTQTLGETEVGGVVRQLARHPFVVSKSSSGGGSISAYGTVVTSVDYVTSTGDPDYSAHAYAIRIKRGALTFDPVTHTLSVEEKNNLKQFIDTTPHSGDSGY